VGTDHTRRSLISGAISSLGDITWHERARCADGSSEALRLKTLFFSADSHEQLEARNFCYGCSARHDCLKWALDTKQLWGTWGGRTEDEIRRALSVSYTGQEIKRRRSPHCPYCGARPSHLHVSEIPLDSGGRWATAKLVTCDACKFQWKSRTSANAVNAYHADRAARRQRMKARREKEKARKSASRKKKKTT